jgi:phosphate transport system ATP-binding protein
VLESRRTSNFFYGEPGAVRGRTCRSSATITALIGPSGCGKSTLLRALNRIYGLYPGQRAQGEILLDGEDMLKGGDVGSAACARRHGIPEADALPDVDLRQCRLRRAPLSQEVQEAEMDDIVERALRRAALWDEVKDKLNTSGLGLSGGQQQRLCVARGIAVEPEVLLLDEPASRARSGLDRQARADIAPS